MAGTNLPLALVKEILGYRMGSMDMRMMGSARRDEFRKTQELLRDMHQSDDPDGQAIDLRDIAYQIGLLEG